LEVMNHRSNKTDRQIEYVDRISVVWPRAVSSRLHYGLCSSSLWASPAIPKCWYVDRCM